MSVFSMVLLALILDFLFGEPERIWSRVPHPATLMGRAVNFFDDTLNRGRIRRIKGFVTIGVLVLGALILGLLLRAVPDFRLLEVLVGAALLAHRSLIDHVRDVADALRQGLPKGRNAVSMIVGRDTGAMDQGDVSRAAIESAAENFSDAVIAPAFWFLLLGLPGILIYKVVNTADSMIGHENARYGEFGYASAKLDDLLNWVPARLSALLICGAYMNRAALDVVFDDADMHRSPNAGWPEAAMAGVLNVALSGPRSYGDEMTRDPFVNRKGKRDLGPEDIERSVAVLNRSWALFAGLIAIPVLMDLLL